MVMACCDYCYAKYIDKNGVVNQKDIDRHEKAMKKSIDQQLNDPKNKESIAKNPPVFHACTCRCMCHVKGLDVRH